MSLPLTSTASSTVSRIAFLDVARGFAAFLVLAEHVMVVLFPDFQKATVGYAVVGKAGVILFFVISGFIIPYSLRRAGSYTRFWLRRAFRLYPVYWLSIGLMLVILYCQASDPHEHLLPGYYHTTDWLINLTMLQGFVTGRNIIGVFWTLQLELIFYAACCLFLFMDWFKRIRILAVVAFVVFALAEVAATLEYYKTPIKITNPMLAILATIVGYSAQQYASGQMTLRFLLLIVLTQTTAFVGVWFAGYRRLPDEVSVGTLGELAVTWGTAYVLFFTLLGLRHLHMPGILSFLGRISYSIYLLHLPAMQVVANTHISMWWKFLGSVGLTIGLSTLTFYLIEEPGIRLGRWLETLIFPRLRFQTDAPAPAAIPAVINP